MKPRKLFKKVVRARQFFILSVCFLVALAFSWTGVTTSLRTTAFAISLNEKPSLVALESDDNAVDQMFGAGTTEKAKGKVDETVGKVERNVGKATGQTEGAAKEAKGKAEQSLGEARNRLDEAESDVEEASDNLLDAVKDLFGQ